MKIQDYCETKKCDCSDCEINKNHESGNCEKLFDAYTLGYNKAIDDFLTEICKMIVQSESNGNYRFYAVKIKQSIADLAEQLKAGGENEN